MSRHDVVPAGAIRSAGNKGDLRRVLFVAYLFPPTGGAGVQRTLKFVKYLEDYGWRPSVLTVANPSVPVLDATLGRDIPQQLTVRRAPTWEPAYALKAAVSATSENGHGSSAFRPRLKGLVRRLANGVLQPDPQVLWMPGAVRAGYGLLRESPHAAIVATAPPFSAFLIGAALSRRTGLPLVLDYRDEWTLSNTYWENKRPGWLAQNLQTRLQNIVLRSARAVVATTESSAATLEQLCKSIGSPAQVAYIPNGFDAADFAGDHDLPREPGPYRLAYVGTLWNITSVAPLVEAVELLARDRPLLAAQLELVFAGRRTAAQQQLVERFKALPCRVIEHAYLDHTQAVELMRSSDGLCALISDLPGAQRILPAKMFEYMAARRRILAIAPRGEVWNVLRDCPRASSFEPRDVEGIARHLIESIEGRNQEVPVPDWDASRYDRRNLAGQLAELLRSITNRA